MTLHASRLRGAVVRAVGILGDPTLSPDFRVQSALDVLRDALDADPGVQAALARIREDGVRTFYRVLPNGPEEEITLDLDNAEDLTEEARRRGLL